MYVKKQISSTSWFNFHTYTYKAGQRRQQIEINGLKNLQQNCTFRPKKSKK